MNFLRNFLSAIVSSLLVLILTFFIVVASFNKVILDPNVFLSTLEKNQTYEKIATEVFPQLLLGVNFSSEENKLTAEALDRITETIDKTKLTVISDQIQKIFEGAYLYVIGENDGFEEKIELVNYLGDLKSTITAAVSSLKAQGELAEVNPDQIVSHLSNENYILVINQDRLTIISPDGDKLSQEKSNNDNNFSLKNLRSAAESSQQSESMLLAGSIFLAILLFLTRLTHFISGFRWLGGALITAGIVPLVLSFVLLAIKPVDLIRNLIESNPDFEFPKATLTLLSANLSDLLNIFLTNLRLFSAILVVVGILIYGVTLVAQIFLNSRHQKPKEIKASN